jgi:DNA-binding HxlR family transcriptional regulator
MEQPRVHFQPIDLAFRAGSGHTKGVDKAPRSNCPVSRALEAIGDRWSLLILRDLILRGKRRYQEFLDSEEGISTNILADRLARLERQGLISKSGDPDDKRQFVYTPTEKGLDLLPVVFEMARWSMKYDPSAKGQQSLHGPKAHSPTQRRRIVAWFAAARQRRTSGSRSAIPDSLHGPGIAARSRRA